MSKENGVPYTWLDPMLTGSNAAIGNSPYNDNDIENLLSAVSKQVDRYRKTELAAQKELIETLAGALKPFAEIDKKQDVELSTNGFWGPCRNATLALQAHEKSKHV